VTMAKSLGPSCDMSGKEDAGFQHETVLLKESVDFLMDSDFSEEKERLIVDGTLGGGGHSESLLMAGARVIGLDQDPAALEAASARLLSYGDLFEAVHSNFEEIDTVLKERGITGVDGMLLDLGVSSPQLDVAERGFSFRQDGPLDMRMNPEADRTAAELVNEESEEELARIFFEYGEERQSRKIARAIVNAREKKPFTRTSQLADFIAKVAPSYGRIHAATRSFQGLRIAVNRELEVLEVFLEKAGGLLNEGGRLVIITFHSLEDRIVKHYFKKCSRPWLDRPEWPEPRPNPDYQFELVTRKAMSPAEEEVEKNRRARSSKLRVVQKIKK